METGFIETGKAIISESLGFNLKRRKGNVNADFFRAYAAMMMLGTQPDESLERIATFLAMQKSQKPSTYCLTFKGGEYHGASVIVEDPASFDFAGAWIMDGYRRIEAIQAGKPLAKDKLQELADEIQNDFEFDGLVASISHSERQSGKRREKSSVIKCRVEDDILTIFRWEKALVLLRELEDAP